MTKTPISLCQAVVKAARAAGVEMTRLEQLSRKGESNFEVENSNENKILKHCITTLSETKNALIEADEQNEPPEEGLVTYLKAQALATPGSFLTLLGKVGMGREDENLPPITRIELVAPQKQPESDEDDAPRGQERRYDRAD